MMAAPIAIGAVDALVSNTNNFTVVPVRPDSYRDRLWVLARLLIRRGGFVVFTSFF